MLNHFIHAPIYLTPAAKSVTQINLMVHVVIDTTPPKHCHYSTVLTWVKPKTLSDIFIKRPNPSSTLMTVASSMISPIA